MQPSYPVNFDPRIRFMETAEESYSSSDIKLKDPTKSTLLSCENKIISVASSSEVPETLSSNGVLAFIVTEKTDVTFGSFITGIKNYVREHPIKSLAIGVASLAAAVVAGCGICQAANINPVRTKRDVSQDPFASETTEIETLHVSTLVTANDLNGTRFRTALARFEFEDEACQHSLLSSILNCTDSSEVLAQHPNIVWSSDQSGRPVTSAKLNREQFSRALGHSVSDVECLLRMSAEPLMTRKTIAEIRRNAVSRDIQQQLALAQHQASGRGEQYCVEITGDKLGERRVECRERYIAVLQNETETSAVNSEVEIDTSEACVSRIALISDGIRQGTAAAANVVSTIRFNQSAEFNQTAGIDLSHLSNMASFEGSYPMDAPVLRSPTNQTIAEIFTDSVVRRCPNVKIDDYRVAVSVESRNDSSVVASVLSAEYFIQALDYIQLLPSQDKPEVAIAIEPDPMPSNYLPDVLLAGDYIEKLSKKGTRVITLDPPGSSWLSQVPYIVHAPDTSSAVAKEQDFSLPPRTMTPREKILLATEAVIAASAVIGASAGVYACARAKQRSNKATKEKAPEHEMQSMHTPDNGSKDIESSADENASSEDESAGLNQHQVNAVKRERVIKKTKKKMLQSLKCQYLEELVAKQNALKRKAARKK